MNSEENNNLKNEISKLINEYVSNFSSSENIHSDNQKLKKNTFSQEKNTKIITYNIEGENKEFYENGQLKEIFQVSNGLKNGPFKIYNEKGEIEQKGNYDNGFKQGNSKNYLSFGFIENVYYENGVLNGPFELLFDNGQLCRKGYYKNGKSFGNQEEYYKNGQLKSKGYWCPDKGRLQIKEFYFEDGQRRMELSEEIEQLSILTGYVYERGKEGGIKYWLNPKENEHGDIEGPYKRYYITGELYCEGNEKDYFEEGIYKEYFKNGQLKKLKTYEDGYLTGPSESYTEDGNLVSREIYFKDKLID